RLPQRTAARFPRRLAGTAGGAALSTLRRVVPRAGAPRRDRRVRRAHGAGADQRRSRHAMARQRPALSAAAAAAVALAAVFAGLRAWRRPVRLATLKPGYYH